MLSSAIGVVFTLDYFSLFTDHRGKHLDFCRHDVYRYNFRVSRKFANQLRFDFHFLFHDFGQRQFHTGGHYVQQLDVA
jgi:hypothetical protein